MEMATVAALPALLAELDGADAEHTDVSVKDEHEWALIALPSGTVIWENVESDDEPRHLRGLNREAVMNLLTALVVGDYTMIESHPWESGY